MDDYERILSVKPEILVYRIPPRPSNRGYRAADWGLDKPSWTGRMRIISKADKVSVKLEDKITGELFAQAPIDTYPGVSVESVTDSSRYFVLKISDGSGRTAFIGIGFADRGDAFDFNVTLQDHFNSVRKDKEIEESGNSQPALDLQLKEGQTFKINLGGKLGSKDRSRPRTNAAPSTGGLLLPPPPGGVAKPSMQPTQQQSEFPAPIANLVSLGQPTGQFNQTQSTSDWGEFSSAPISGGTTDNAQGWVQF